MPFDIDARIDEWKRSLLDTTKRNRLIKFTTGRGGGIAILHPPTAALWRLLVVDGKPAAFPWKREILGLPADIIDGGPSESASADPSGEGSASDPAVRTARDLMPKQGSLFPARSPAPRPKTIQELTADCLASPRLGPDDLLTEFSDKKLAAHLLRLSRAASEAETEHGVSTLYAAFGFLHWYESPDSDEPIRSPLVLVPIRLERESVESAWTLRAEDDDPSTNHCLTELLASDFRVQLPTGAEAEIDAEGVAGLADYLRRVAGLVKSMPRWRVAEEAAIGVFNFQKLAMWQDIESNAERVKSHLLCRAIAGDAHVQLRPPPGLVVAADLDEKVPPDAANHILDADSSQHEAIEAVKHGADVVVDGPPGTGKSQTIANAIAELLSAGKTVLFVSEKTAALEVVKRRLDDCGLGDFCLELHSHKANKREVTAELGRCLELGPEACPDLSAEMRQLADDRRRLNAYAAELHRPRMPLNLSAFQVHGELARLADLPDLSRWSATDVLGRDAEFLRRATDVLAGLARCRSAVEDPAGHPWRGCRMTVVTQAGLDDARHHLRQLAAASTRLAEGTTLADLALEGPADTVGRWRAAANCARSVLAVPQIPPSWFTADPQSMSAAAAELHAATGRIRFLNESLRMFSPEAVRRLTADAASDIARGLARRQELLADGGGLSARQRVRRLRDLAVKLTTACGLLSRLADAYGRLLTALRIPGKPAPVSQARKFAQVAAELAASEPVLRSWWDAGRRAEVQGVAEKAAQEEAAASALRARMATTLSPAAFAPDAGPVVREALHLGSSFWRWLSPRWGKLRRQVAGWYAGPAPGRAGLMADLEALDEYHRRSGYARQVEAEYAADLARGPSGRADWDATTVGLKAVDRYEKWKLPAELKSGMAPGGGLDRAALAEAVEDLKTADIEFKAAWEGLLTGYARADPAELNRTAAELVTRLEAVVEEARAEAATLERLTGLLRDGQDLPAGTWAVRSGDLAELVKLRRQVAAHASSLGIDAPPSELEFRDWSDLAAAGAGLRAFLGGHVRRPSPATVAALCDAEARGRVRAAVEVSDAAVRDGLEESWPFVAGTLFPADVLVSDGLVLSKAPLPELARWAGSRLADLHRAEEWVRYQQVRREAAALGIESVVDEVSGGRVRADRAGDAFRRRFLGLWLDALYGRVPELAEFAADDHDALVERFGRLDKLAIDTAAGRLRSRLLALRRPRRDESAPATSELGLLLREANKKKRHMPLRRLFAQIPTVLPRLKPCLMMSPLAVSTYLNPPVHAFDVVIFDEASQVRPHDAVCAVYRGRQLVVAGDPRQLPPTDFFNRSAADELDEEDEEGGTAGFESLLDVCLSLGLVRKRLRWHYRSRREGLIAFSNKHFYEGGLVTFPSVEDGADSPVRLVRVAEGRFEDGANVAEARRVAGLVMDHFRTSPGLTLGVIAFSQRQQNRILDELEALRRCNPDLENFFKEDRSERFFVKNLENVQGDERDVMLLSVGYGPDAAGKVAMRFGPLNRQGGERRLNVAVTRARVAMTVVASMTAADIDLSRTQAEGARLLRAFLDYAERGPRALAEAIADADAGGFESPFEREVFEELQRRGLTLHKQVGCSGFRIDLAVLDPAAVGRYLLGVECDGATYHSSPTARDRDRLRQEVLERLGWRLCRIWSSDWLRNRDKQVGRVFAALQEANQAPAPPAEKAAPPPGRPANPPPAPTEPTGPTYATISDVPEFVIQATTLAVVGEFGATDPEGLCVAVARRLGFKRLGAKIRDRIESSRAALAREGKLELRQDGRWGPPTTAVC
jgi:very-short-patch-repair endonuclease